MNGWIGRIATAAATLSIGSMAIALPAILGSERTLSDSEAARIVGGEPDRKCGVVEECNRFACSSNLNEVDCESAAGYERESKSYYKECNQPDTEYYCKESANVDCARYYSWCLWNELEQRCEPLVADQTKVTIRSPEKCEQFLGDEPKDP